jgi:hypothetical protein
MKAFFVFLMVTLALLKLDAQHVSRSIVSLGNDVSIEEGYYLSSSFGQVAYETLETTNYHLTQGFQQPSLIHFEKPVYADLVKVYPNPVVDKLTVEFTSDEESNYIVQVFSLAGELLRVREYLNVEGKQKEKINVSHFATGLYIVHVFSRNRVIIKTFKIDKINK